MLSDEISEQRKPAQRADFLQKKQNKPELRDQRAKNILG